MGQRDGSLAIFKKSWTTYQKIIKGGEMNHAQISNALAEAVLSMGKAKISVLDLGCGDAYIPARVLGELEGVVHAGSVAFNAVFLRPCAHQDAFRWSPCHLPRSPSPALTSICPPLTPFLQRSKR
jgi:hypothetical protein